MSLKYPNYYNDDDRRLYNILWQQPNELLTDSERDFVRTMYEQEEYSSYSEQEEEYEHEQDSDEEQQEEEESYSG